MFQLNSRIDGLLRVVAGRILTEDRGKVHQSRPSNLGPATYLYTGTIPLHFNVCLHLHQRILNYQPSLLATPTRVHRVASTQITTFSQRENLRKIKILFQSATQQTLNWVGSGVEHGERSVVCPDQINSHDTGIVLQCKFDL